MILFKYRIVFSLGQSKSQNNLLLHRGIIHSPNIPKQNNNDRGCLMVQCKVGFQLFVSLMMRPHVGA